MHDIHDMHDDPDEGLPPAEYEVAHRLTAERPIPSPRFRGALGRYLGARDPGYGPRPPRLRLAVAGYLLVGALLIVLGALLAVS